MARTEGFVKAKKDLQLIGEQLEVGMKGVGRRGTRSMSNDAKKEIMAPNVYGASTLATGALHDSVGTRSESDGHHHEFATVATSPTARLTEFGTGVYNTETDPAKSFRAPSFTPRLRRNIQAWIVIKGIRSRRYPNATAEELSFAIARQIAQFGTRQYAFMRPAYRRNERDIKMQTRAVFRKVLR